MDFWYMVFDEDPHGNRDIPFYFLMKLYAKFILGKHMNYFYILYFQGMGHGMPKNRDGDRTNPNHVPCPLCTPKPPRLDPHEGPMIDDTHEALFDLADTLLQHGTVVQGNVGQGVGTSEDGPSHSKDPSTYPTGDAECSEHRVTPHPCTSCGGICYGPALEF